MVAGSYVTQPVHGGLPSLPLQTGASVGVRTLVYQIFRLQYQYRMWQWKRAGPKGYRPHYEYIRQRWAALGRSYQKGNSASLMLLEQQWFVLSAPLKARDPYLVPLQTVIKDLQAHQDSITRKKRRVRARYDHYLDFGEDTSEPVMRRFMRDLEAFMDSWL